MRVNTSKIDRAPFLICIPGHVECAPGGSDEATPVDLPLDSSTEFISRVLADTEDTWSELFRGNGLTYRVPTLVLFSGMVESACGFQSAAVGPFYCPGDGKVYPDLSFFEELARLGGRGDFAQAYVLGHEVGHHVQNQLGYFEPAEQLKRRNPTRSNAVSVRLEPQADCLAGVWAHHTDFGKSWNRATLKRVC